MFFHRFREIDFNDLLNEAIQYASIITDLSDSHKAIIKHCRKAVLFYNDELSEKKS